MREPTPEDIARLESEATTAETALEREIAEAIVDANEIATAIREARLRLEEEQARGATGLDSLLAALKSVATPIVPLRNHQSRILEARADALRARLWVVSAMRDELKRFTFELSECMKTTEEAREALNRLASQPRINQRPRLERIRAITADLAARRGDERAASVRRQQPRVRLETVIDLHTQSNFYTGHTENISDGGLFLATDEPLATGAEVDLAFSLPGGIEVRTRGVVRWSRSGTEAYSAGHGIAFTDLSESARQAIQRFIQRREPIIH